MTMNAYRYTLEEIGQLNDENDRLRAEIERLTADREKYFLENLEMRAEIERLRAALQDLIDRWPTEQGYDGAIKRARRALEGK